MFLPRPARPGVLWNDVRAFIQQRSGHRWWAGALAVAIPITILAGFYIDSAMHAQPRPEIRYITSWPADRSDDEIKASQQAQVARQRAIQAERQRQFKQLEEQNRRLGIR